MDEVWSFHTVCGFENCPPTFAAGFAGQILEHVFVPGGGLLGLIFGRYVSLASQSPYPIIVYSVANYRPHLICNFRDPNLVVFYFYELTHFLD